MITQQKIDLRVPSGVEDGMRLRVSGEGEAEEKGAASGDLFVEIHIKPHEIFERKGENLFLDLPITFGMASLGGEVDVPTLDGKNTIKIPSGTQPGTILAIKGKGMPHVHGNRKGDLHIQITVQVPTKLSKRQTELLKEFEGMDTSVKKKGWFQNPF